MGIITVNITVNNIGTDTGPFDIYDDYTGLLITNLTKEDLASGVSIDINDNASQITILSKGICNNNLIVPITTFPLSPTPSATPSISVTRTPSITPSISLTPSETPSITPSVTISPSIIVTRTPSVTPTNSVTPSITPSNSTTPSITPTMSTSATPSVTPTVTVSNTSTPSVSSTPSVTPSVTPSATPGASISISRTPSVTPSVTRTPTVTPTPSSFPTLFLGLSQISADDACTNGELGGYTWILGNRSDTSLCDTSFVRNTSSSILNTIGIGNFFWLRQGSSTRKFQVALFSFGEFAGELYGLTVESCAVCASPSPTPSISISRTPTVTPSISISKTPSLSPTPSSTPPCCTYYDLNISADDTDGAFGNTSYANGVVYVNYTDCYDTAQSLPLSAGTYTNQICVKPNTVVNLIYYNNDNPIVAINSTKTQQGCCSPYPPPSASPTPSISITRTPTPSVTAGISISPTPTRTPTPTVTPASPTAFTFTDTFQSNALIDCTGEGDLGLVTTREYEIILRDNCINQNVLAAQSSLSFAVQISCTSGNTTDNIFITGGNSAYSNSYESNNACTGVMCSVSLTSSPGSLTQC